MLLLSPDFFSSHFGPLSLTYPSSFFSSPYFSQYSFYCVLSPFLSLFFPFTLSFEFSPTLFRCQIVLCHYLIHSVPPILFFNFAEMSSSHLLYPLISTHLLSSPLIPSIPSLPSNVFPDLCYSMSCPVNFISSHLLPHLLSWSLLQDSLSIIHNIFCAIFNYELRSLFFLFHISLFFPGRIMLYFFSFPFYTYTSISPLTSRIVFIVFFFVFLERSSVN